MDHGLAESCLTQTVEGPFPSSTQNTLNNNKKRQLPPWMLGVTGAETVGRNGTVETSRSGKSHGSGKNLLEENDISFEGIRPEKKRPKRATTRPTKHTGSSSTRRFPETGVEMGSMDNSGDRDDGKRVPKPRKQIVSREPRGRRKKKNPQFEEDPISDVEDDFEGRSEVIAVENGVDLDVEDLLCMAKQHVEAEEKADVEIHCTRADLKSELQEPEKLPRKVTSVFCNDEWKDLSYSTRCSEVASSATENTTRDFSKGNIGGKESFTLVTQSQSNTVSDPVGTPDDIAQNMLDLLLGPSLAFSQNDSKKSHLLLEEFNSAPHLAEPDNRTEEAPIFKKKSSLRDKVTMLLS